jgi:hypothetical protein
MISSLKSKDPMKVSETGLSRRPKNARVYNTSFRFHATKTNSKPFCRESNRFSLKHKASHTDIHQETHGGHG